MKRVVIIAEAGVNHNGDMDKARALIDAAADAQADYVKFQTFRAAKIASPDAEKASYQKENSGAGESQFEMLRRLELSEEDHDMLITYCEQKNIRFLSTAFDEDSIRLLKSKGITLGKIPSGEITNKPYLQAMAKNFPNIILSTGMCTMQEVKDAIAVVKAAGTSPERITVLHCNTEYPTPMQDVNLRAMENIRSECGVRIGYSDHTLGIEVPIAAVALGAEVIEKHFTLDRNLPGPDHKASLEPNELKAMISGIRNIEMALSGSGMKEPSPSEIKNMKIARKSIHAQRAMEAGHTISLSDLIMIRPGDGISPMEIDQVIGKKTRRAIQANEKLTWESLT